MTSLRPLLCALAALLALPACTDQGTISGPSPVVVRQGQNQDLSFPIHSAVDRLASFGAADSPAVFPLRVAVPAPVDRPDHATPLGRLLAEEIAARLVQKGLYVTDTPPVAGTAGVNMDRVYRESLLKGGKTQTSAAAATTVVAPRASDGALVSVPPGTHPAAGGVVTGTYAVAGNWVYLTLRLTRAMDNLVVATSTARLPIDPQIASLLPDDIPGGDTVAFMTTGGPFGPSLTSAELGARDYCAQRGRVAELINRIPMPQSNYYRATFRCRPYGTL